MRIIFMGTPDFAVPCLQKDVYKRQVLRCLWKEHEVPYTKVFEQAESKSQMVATFLAVLELVKGKRVRVEDENGISKLVLLDGGERNWKRKHKKVQ